jgi:hypothetical protein
MHSIGDAHTLHPRFDSKPISRVPQLPVDLPVVTLIKYSTLVKSFSVARAITGGDRRSGTLRFNSKCCADSQRVFSHCIPMPDDWNFVDSWLDDVLNSQRLKTPSLKWASVSPQDGITRIAQQIAPPSIPTTLNLTWETVLKAKALRSFELLQLRYHAVAVQAHQNPG